MDQFRRLADGADSSSNADYAARPETLSEKEGEVLRLIAEGMSNRQIATAMFLAEGTIKNYVSRMMEKLHANTRTALVVMSAKRR